MQPMCVLGCLDPDPDPNAAGYFLPGYENQWTACADWSVDLDQDGLDDNCEYKLALTFAPQLSFLLGDDVSREPRWAARWAGQYAVGILYMPSYYQDGGVAGGSVCQIVSSACDPHIGDAEWIYLVVVYDPSSQHWALKGGLLSAHDWHVPMVTTAPDTVPASLPPGQAGVGFEWPDKVGGFPRIYVADGKHANYPTQQYCKDHGGRIPVIGSITDSDECTTPRTLVRIEVPVNGNVGSSDVNLINCVTSGNPNHPAYTLQEDECYWTPGRRFHGWFHVDNGDFGGVYGDILRSRGF
ncbi:MAG TPA: hypothetical protein PLL69_08750 [Gemmatimonadales bacterium]|nr:hypothetical protein [Gemmatimonadales bacterium]